MRKSIINIDKNYGSTNPMPRDVYPSRKERGLFIINLYE